MKGPDLDRLRSEKKLSLKDFASTYNEGLPNGYPRATPSLLKLFSAANAHLFKSGSIWSLDQHRKKVMDWLPSHVRSTEE